MRKLGLVLIILVASLIWPFSQASAVTVECTEEVKYCASSTNAVVASYATTAYFHLNAILNLFGEAGETVDDEFNGNTAMMENNNFRLYAALVYILSVIGAMIMMALGQQPKMYVWFAAGPAIFYFLLFNTMERGGVAWDIGHVRQEQQVVWEIANTSINASKFFPSGNLQFEENGPNKNIKLPWYFVVVDDVISELVQNLVNVFGIADQMKPLNGENVPDNSDEWHLFSQEKWELLETITQAKIYSTELKEMWVFFMASDCGDKLSRYVDKVEFVKASNTNGKNLPENVFLDGKEAEILDELQRIRLSVPMSFNQLFQDVSPQGFTTFAYGGQTDLVSVHTISCDDLLYLIMQGMRWEAGMHYGGMSRSSNNNLVDLFNNIEKEKELIDYVLLYDWAFANGGSLTTERDRRDFITNMIFAYMFRNELALLPDLVRTKLLPAEKASIFAEEFSRNINSKNKFAEFYTWTKLLPHIQGLIIYMLAIGYPVACVFILVPGWWKWLFTWTSFFIWVKSWDVGFAVVMTLEKTIWANLGKTVDSQGLNQRILDLDAVNPDITINFDNNVVSFVAEDPFDPLQMNEEVALNLFDQALTLSRALNHDLANSYYIYLMSAMYFAVPAILGQVMLGAKSGMAGMVKDAIGGVSGEAGGATRSGAVADMTHDISMASQAGNQQYVLGQARKDGLALRAMQDKNQAMATELFSSKWTAVGKQRSGAAQQRQAMNTIGGAISETGYYGRLFGAESARVLAQSRGYRYGGDSQELDIQNQNLDANKQQLEQGKTQHQEMLEAVKGNKPTPTAQDADNTAGGRTRPAQNSNATVQGRGQGGRPQAVPHQGGRPQQMPHQGGVPQQMLNQGGRPQAVPHQGGVPQRMPNQGGRPQQVPRQGGVQQQMPHQGGGRQQPVPQGSGKPQQVPHMTPAGQGQGRSQQLSSSAGQASLGRDFRSAPQNASSMVQGRQTPNLQGVARNPNATVQGGGGEGDAAQKVTLGTDERIGDWSKSSSGIASAVHTGVGIKASWDKANMALAREQISQDASQLSRRTDAMLGGGEFVYGNYAKGLTERERRGGLRATVGAREIGHLKGGNYSADKSGKFGGMGAVANIAVPNMKVQNELDQLGAGKMISADYDSAFAYTDAKGGYFKGINAGIPEIQQAGIQAQMNFTQGLNTDNTWTHTPAIARGLPFTDNTHLPGAELGQQYREIEGMVPDGYSIDGATPLGREAQRSRMSVRVEGVATIANFTQGLSGHVGTKRQDGERMDRKKAEAEKARKAKDSQKPGGGGEGGGTGGGLRRD